MDKSQNYITMSFKAKKIQALALDYLDQGSFFMGRNEIYCIGETIGNIFEMAKDYLSKGDVWLPRQDQLQMMVFDKGTCMSDATINVCNWYINQYADRYCSMEELWLSFVMYKKYNKIWNGIDWEKEKGK